MKRVRNKKGVVMQIQDKPTYTTFLPSEVRLNSLLSPMDKLIYSEIVALAQATGACFATNSYLAELYKVSQRTVIRAIKNLEELGYIKTEITYKNGTKEIEKRAIRAPKPHLAIRGEQC